jgi:hypothetical protein
MYNLQLDLGYFWPGTLHFIIFNTLNGNGEIKRLLVLNEDEDVVKVEVMALICGQKLDSSDKGRSCRGSSCSISLRNNCACKLCQPKCSGGCRCSITDGDADVINCIGDAVNVENHIIYRRSQNLRISGSISQRQQRYR